ncbi:Fun14p [Saccharomyces cerevisiae x Saccharomyces kudriavzevii VIN7]|uniref:Fun14p n=1 Tax=Saccharomyces cerevisiae x Saccharomyces kudriavzevii (strain VIN7) TaxID=1095631 RepID=H0GQV4_SACCK|nr:Fun14p [Saccharomyces cerevisiae x Saccharomyces kudriavzevii VIN7]
MKLNVKNTLKPRYSVPSNPSISNFFKSTSFKTITDLTFFKLIRIHPLYLSHSHSSMLVIPTYINKMDILATVTPKTTPNNDPKNICLWLLILFLLSSVIAALLFSFGSKGSRRLFCFAAPLKESLNINLEGLQFTKKTPPAATPAVASPIDRTKGIPSFMLLLGPRKGTLLNMCFPAFKLRNINRCMVKDKVILMHVLYLASPPCLSELLLVYL